MKKNIFLALLAIIAMTAAVNLLATGKVSAWAGGLGMQCDPALRARFYGRCERQGMFTGADERSCTPLVNFSNLHAGQDPCLNNNPKGNQDRNISLPLPPLVSNTYSEAIGTSGSNSTWTVPKVNDACSADAFGNSPACYQQSICTNANNCYAHTFEDLLKIYLVNWEQNILHPTPSCLDKWPPADQVPGPQAVQYTGCALFRAEAVGAAMVVDTILGYNFTSVTPKTWAPLLNSPNNNPSLLWLYGIWQPNQMEPGIKYAIDNFQTFIDRITQYDNLGYINWDAYIALPAGHTNSTGILYGTDNEFFESGTSSKNRAIVIYDGAGLNKKALWEMNRFCGNLVGNVNPVPPLSGSNFRFNAYAFPPAPNIDDYGATQAVFHTGIGIDGTNFQGKGVTLDNFSQFFYIKKYGGGNVPIVSVLGPPHLGPQRITGQLDVTNGANLPGNLQAGDQVCVTVFVSPSSGTWDSGGDGGGGGGGGGGGEGGGGEGGGGSDWRITSKSGTSTQESCYELKARPYYKIFGGDVVAGSGIGQTCSAKPDQSIIGYNQNSSPFKGAGAQFAAQVGPQQSPVPGSQIIDFASGQNLSSNSPNTGYNLSFANNIYTSTGGSPSTFGGDFGGTTNSFQGAAPCAPTDFGQPPKFQQAYPSGTPTLLLSNILNGIVNLGNVTGKNPIYISGANVLIDTNVIYANQGTWAQPSDIPNFSLVVTGGNIFVKPSVSEIDGTYEARPFGANTGSIFTCTTDGNLPAGDYYTTCKNQLKIYGSFIADTIRFMRTGGTISLSTANESRTTSQAGEMFVYSPEQWLGAISPGQPTTYDSINDLPPVL